MVAGMPTAPTALLRDRLFRVKRAAAALVHEVPPLRGSLEGAAGLVGLWPLVVLLIVFATRLAYPMDLEWCEGGIIYQAYRLLHGLPIYVRDDPTWQPWPYPPGQTAVLALIGLIRLDFWSARLVSVVSFLAACFVLAREVFRHLGGKVLGLSASLLAIATIACAYPVSGQWYDLARVDSLTFAWVFLAAARVVNEDRSQAARQSWKRHLVTAALLTVSLYTKQTAIFFVGWILLFAFLRAPRVGLRLGVLVAAMGATVLGFLQWRTGGAYWYWTIDTMSKHALDDARIVDGLRLVTRYAPFWVGLPLAPLLLALPGWLRPRTIFWLGMLLAALPASLLPYAKNGGYLNNLIPMLMLIGPVTALLLGDLVQGAASSQRWLAAAGRWALLGGLALFAVAHRLEPQTLVPDARMWRAARELNAIAAGLEGGLVVPELTFLPARSGQRNLHWHAMAIYDAIWSGREMDEVKAFENAGARYVLLNSIDHGGFANYVRGRSRLALALPPSARVRMMTGNPITVDELWEIR